MSFISIFSFQLFKQLYHLWKFIKEFSIVLIISFYVSGFLIFVFYVLFFLILFSYFSWERREVEGMASQMLFLTKSQQLIFVRRTNIGSNTAVQITSKTLVSIQLPISALKGKGQYGREVLSFVLWPSQSLVMKLSGEGLVLSIILQTVTGKSKIWLHVGSVSFTLTFAFHCFCYYNH